MALEHDFGKEKEGGGFVTIDESGTLTEEKLLEMMKIMSEQPQQPIVWGRRQGFFKLGADFGKGVNMFIQEYPTEPPAPPTVVFKHGDVEKSITLTGADLRPQNAFKLNQKIGAMIKSAYNTKTKGVKNGNAARHHGKTG